MIRTFRITFDKGESEVVTVNDETGEWSTICYKDGREYFRNWGRLEDVHYDTPADFIKELRTENCEEGETIDG